uniref:PLA2c domain-containing protein n=1 Tax=Sinocyclocheilus rhinocerous TaxID=307959 RepID=A0A673GQL2_9TELE
CCSSEVRFGHSLNKEEEEFVARRKNTVLQCLQKFNIHCSQDKVPNIALLGSGGGQRAMVALLECLVELDKAGLLDCILYLSGVSGSTWCMASLYQEPDWSTKLETVKDNIIKRLSGPGVSWDDKSAKLKKYYMKDFFSLTDLWAVFWWNLLQNLKHPVVNSNFSTLFQTSQSLFFRMVSVEEPLTVFILYIPQRSALSKRFCQWSDMKNPKCCLTCL